MIEEERNRLREESLDEFINNFNEDPFEKRLKEQWWKIRFEYHEHLHTADQEGQSPHLEECKKLFMTILEESIKRYENDPLTTDKGQLISKNVMAISKLVFFNLLIKQNSINPLHKRGIIGKSFLGQFHIFFLEN